MRAEELDELTDQQLQQKANICFIVADNLNINLGHNYSEKLRLLLEAQFYLTHAVRKRAEQKAEQDKQHNLKIEKRDFWMEAGVMVLIGGEIILSLFGLWEGSKQADVLAHMDTSTAATATMTKSVADDQKKSSEVLGKMNANLETSAGVLADQLRILKETQAETKTQQSKKPIFSLELPGGASLFPPRTLENMPLYKTETSISGDFRLKNSGPAIAHTVWVDVKVVARRKEVTVEKLNPADNLEIQEVNPAVGPYEEVRHYRIRLGDLRQGDQGPLPLAFNFPKDHSGFGIYVYASSEESISSTLVWEYHVPPWTPKPLSPSQ